MFFKYKIDYLVFITGEVQRTIGGVFTEATMIRPAGLSNEPASYALFTVSILFCLLVHNKKIDFLKIIGILSIFLSFSASGVMFLAIIMVVVYSNEIFSLKKTVIYFTVLLSSYVIFKIFIIDIIGEKPINSFIYKISNFQEYESYKQRIGNIFVVFNDLPITQKIFGIGYGNISIQDSLGSFISKFIIKSGVFFSIPISVLLMWIFYTFKVQFKYVLIAVLFTLSTHYINLLVTWFFLSILLVFSSNSKNLFQNKH
ncbi:hypothetical protein GCM10023315_16210 [Algibacter aquimarinus]|uniref:Uncharacterized protein n=1 Tax=Algibacter aquimarinus TaxID=1136748 RepID=A0ABP9HCN1_9FLAO